MEWELVLQEPGKPDDVRIVSADNIDPLETINVGGRDWKYVRDEPSSVEGIPVRVFFTPA